MEHSKWTTVKPEFTEDCIVISAYTIRGIWEYDIWQVKKTNSDEGWYWGWFTGDGEEYGDLNDFSTQMYMTLPLLK